MVALNLMFQVGAANEQPGKTGLAHFLEHLFFSGSTHAPHYDRAMEAMGGQNNAYTSQDVTCYHATVPAGNLERLLWLEADRFAHLTCSQEAIEVQRKVVLEEFQESTLNTPYGDLWQHLLELQYPDPAHPYHWATIGRSLEEVENLSAADIFAFRERHYVMSNAALAIVGGVSPADTLQLVEKWFGGFPTRPQPPQPAFRPAPATAVTTEVKGSGPCGLVAMVCDAPPRAQEEALHTDLLVRLMTDGNDAWLHKRLVEELGVCTDVEAFASASMGPGLLCLQGLLAEGVSLTQGQEAMARAVDSWQTTLLEHDHAWDRTRHQLECSHLFRESSLGGKAGSLARAILLGGAQFFTEEMERLRQLDKAALLTTGATLLAPSRRRFLLYQGGSASLSDN